MTKSAKKTTQEQVSEQIPFAAEIGKVLQLMIHSLYTNRDIFLRELISNASDACDKLRYEALTRPELLEGDTDLGIHLAFDEKAKTLTVTDNGIGMNHDELIANLGTIAKSGTQEFAKILSGDAARDVNLIGQFGVGFYSAFMVADKVEVHSHKAGDAESWRWVSDGAGAFSVTQAEDRARGTAITLHLKDDATDYLDKHKLRFIAETYSDHIGFPIQLTDAEGHTDTINKASALWTRNKADITEDQYQEFYRHVAHSPDKPWAVLHNKAEGKVEYTNLLFVPSIPPFDLFRPERRTRVKLYVKRVFITEEGVELVPQYLRFLRGVIDSEDLPLNISRETLQKNAVLDKIRESVTTRVLTELKKRAEKDIEDYGVFWKNFGAVLKEGLCEGHAPREKILEASRFYSSASPDQLISLDTYIARMKEGQEAIYFLIGDSVKALAASAQIEGFIKRGIEVVFLTDHVDDFWTNVTHSYKEKPFRSVMRAGEDLKAFPAPENESTEKPEPAADVTSLIARMKTLFGDEVRDVRTTEKLDESPACLGVSEGDMDPRMERFLLEHKQLPKRMSKILELNPRHPVITKLNARVSVADSAEVDDALWLILDQARLAEGEPLTDAAAYAKRVAKLMERVL
jgi:molecular chaperone HtpG